MSLVLNRKEQESFYIDAGNGLVAKIKIYGLLKGQVRIGIEAKSAINIVRSEIVEQGELNRLEESLRDYKE
jgi:carbon storage regulator CsrA